MSGLIELNTDNYSDAPPTDLEQAGLDIIGPPKRRPAMAGHKKSSTTAGKPVCRRFVDKVKSKVLEKLCNPADATIGAMLPDMASQ
jgi:hypothetical protein